MAIVVVAVGAVMVVVGAAEIFYGSGVIELERGWAAFIAGTILLTGGFITMAIGLALRSLGSVRLALLQLGGAYDRPDLTQGLDDFAPGAIALRGAEPAGSLEGPALQIEPHLGLADPSREPAVDAPLLLDEEAPTRRAVQAADASGRAGEGATEAVMADWLDRESTDLDQEMARLYGETDSRAAHAASGFPAASDPNVQRGGSQPDEFGYAAPATIPTIDRPLAEPDAAETAARRYGTDGTGGRRPTAQPRQADGTEQRGAPGRDDLPAASQPAAPPPVAPPMAPPPAPPEPPAIPAPRLPAGPAVIGRYQSEGTSYVMYADGSIEAQTEAGIYRFGSMAELKAFIET